jgi:hypothetical protein
MPEPSEIETFFPSRATTETMAGFRLTQMIFETTRSLKPDSVTQSCPIRPIDNPENWK